MSDSEGTAFLGGNSVSKAQFDAFFELSLSRKGGALIASDSCRISEDERGIRYSICPHGGTAAEGWSASTYHSDDGSDLLAICKGTTRGGVAYQVCFSRFRRFAGDDYPIYHIALKRGGQMVASVKTGDQRSPPSAADELWNLEKEYCRITGGQPITIAVKSGSACSARQYQVNSCPPQDDR